MNSVKVVIGANYGDEGKGHVVDHLCSRETVVVRFNGGSQAGHTVVTPEGKRHVFKHFGSGSFVGAKTFLSRYFITNPVCFRTEWNELAQLGVAPEVTVDPMSDVTTPWDMILNQAAERERGKQRHGSCGWGINETVERNKGSGEFLLSVKDLFMRREKLAAKLRAIYTGYMPWRAAQLGIKNLENEARLDHEKILDRYLDDVEFMLRKAKVNLWYQVADANEDFVFEGAQGLRLDQNFKDFPHVTRSSTGLPNALEMMDEGGFPDIAHVFYVTRPYITRHGAGPLSHELAFPPTEKVVDETNFTNPHQGALRFGHFDVNEFAAPVRDDINRTYGYEDCAAMHHIVFTCVDQIDEDAVTYFNSGEKEVTSFREFADLCMDRTGAFSELYGRGPTRGDLQDLSVRRERLA